MSTSPRVRIGSIKLSFLAGLTPPATLNTKSLYPVSFAEGAGEFNSNAKAIDITSPIAGVNLLVGSPITESLPEYTISLKIFNDNVTALFLGGPTPTTDTEPTSIAVGTNFSYIGWGYMEWFENGDAVGTPYKVHAGFLCQLVPDGGLARDPSKASEPKLKVRLIGSATQRGTYSTTGA